MAMYQKLSPVFDYIYGGAGGVPNQNLYQVPSLDIQTPTIGRMPNYNQVRAANYMPVSGDPTLWNAQNVANQPIGQNPGAQFQTAPLPHNPNIQDDRWPNVMTANNANTQFVSAPGPPSIRGAQPSTAAINPYRRA